MGNRNYFVLAIGLIALAFATGQQVSAKDTQARRSIDAITVDLDPMIGRTTERIGIVTTNQAKKGFALVGTVNCQQQINGGVHDTVILIFER
jgi:hypothetical protein